MLKKFFYRTITIFLMVALVISFEYIFPKFDSSCSLPWDLLKCIFLDKGYAFENEFQHSTDSENCKWDYKTIPPYPGSTYDPSDNLSQFKEAVIGEEKGCAETFYLSFNANPSDIFTFYKNHLTKVGYKVYPIVWDAFGEEGAHIQEFCKLADQKGREHVSVSINMGVGKSHTEHKVVISIIYVKDFDISHSSCPPIGFYKKKYKPILNKPDK